VWWRFRDFFLNLFYFGETLLKTTLSKNIRKREKCFESSLFFYHSPISRSCCIIIIFPASLPMHFMFFYQNSFFCGPSDSTREVPEVEHK
jgi:hypothetical protein